ncbi:SRPBCC family protein [Brucellaceae bacterium C25G]
MAEIKQVFKVNHNRKIVWEKFQDLGAVVACIPGAQLTEPPVDGVAKGRITVKLGPVKADFGGEAKVVPDEANYTGVITGVGIDKNHSSRAKGEVTYVLTQEGENTTVVSVDVNYSLSGSLAQVARGGIVEAVAGQICKEFANNLEDELSAGAEPVVPTGEVADGVTAAAPPPSAPAAPRKAAPAKELNMLSVLWAVFKNKLSAIFGRA